MQNPLHVLILGASYGSLLATKLILAGHTVKLVCLPTEAAVINARGIRLRLPVNGQAAPLEIDSRGQPGALSAATPEAVDPSGHDLVVLAMQEPHYRAPDVRTLLRAVAVSRVPCLSIMNMPPLPYLARIAGLDLEGLTRCYADHTVWDGLDPALMTMCSPDAQAFRPPEDEANVLQVTLPSNFQVAPFDAAEHTAILRRMQNDISAVRYDSGGKQIPLPVELKVRDSIFVPLAKWSMLLTGNYRCVQEDGPRSIQEAVHSDIDRSRAIYNWVGDVCRAIGASREHHVPFERYARVAKRLTKPSSAARALAAGATHIERADKLVRTIAAQLGMQNVAIDQIVALVDAKLAENRRGSPPSPIAAKAAASHETGYQPRAW